MNIGLDIDGTLTKLDRVLEVFNRECKNELTLEDIQYYDLHKCYGVSKDIEKNVWVQYGDYIVKNAVPIKNLRVIVEKFRDISNKIILITSRPKTQREITEAWLKENGVKYDELVFATRDKCFYVPKYNLNVLVDDNPAELMALRNSPFWSVCEGWIIDQPYNKGCYADKRIMFFDDGTLVNILGAQSGRVRG
ncbi:MULTISPECIES: 5' nucleotidase, NT5C type [Bacillus subtilis group]|uniref:5' nucleotidase, NT5C type n=1 Tax=Bacillus TaxID=1386 RepID=UPI000E4FE57B|nr:MULTISPECIES: hypothetical protein [Bacillus subtilis group]MBT3123280.1 hypothetical protein [Bacillus inaquosorum]MCB4338862.1 Nucleotidase [Bacillus subtilis]MCB5337253.1 hypothetical protein [Bacillus amyloliquefaciens]MCF7615300.1 hypothetical protein [Bacillus subtilis]MCL9628392.1 hypothetical protein [Bacillus subtilis]